MQKMNKVHAAFITAAVTSRIDVPAWSRRGRNERRPDEIDEAMSA